MKYTNNLNLKKPDQVDFYDVDDFNFNADELDKKIGEILNAIIIASQNEAETGTDNVRLMSPLRVKQAILKLAPKPAMATQTEAEAGTDNTKHMTALRVKQSILKNAPKQDLSPYAKLASPAFTGTPTAPTASKTTNNTQLATTAFVQALVGAVNNGGIVAQSLGPNGFVKFANGLILQWGNTPSGTGNVTFPITCTNIPYAIMANEFEPSVVANNRFAILSGSVSKKGFAFCGSENDKMWFSIGK